MTMERCETCRWWDEQAGQPDPLKDESAYPWNWKADEWGEGKRFGYCLRADGLVQYPDTLALAVHVGSTAPAAWFVTMPKFGCVMHKSKDASHAQI